MMVLFCDEIEASRLIGCTVVNMTIHFLEASL